MDRTPNVTLPYLSILLSSFIFTALLQGLFRSRGVSPYMRTTPIDEMYPLTMVLLMHTC